MPTHQLVGFLVWFCLNADSKTILVYTCFSSLQHLFRRFFHISIKFESLVKNRRCIVNVNAEWRQTRRLLFRELTVNRYSFVQTPYCMISQSFYLLTRKCLDTESVASVRVTVATDAAKVRVRCAVNETADCRRRTNCTRAVTSTFDG